MAVDLLFTRPLDTSHPVNLIFGESDAANDGADLSFAITLGVSASFTLDASELVSFSIALEPPTLSMVLEFDNAVPRGLRASAAAGWGAAAGKRREVRMPYQHASRLHVGRGDTWGPATRRSNGTASPWGENTRLPSGTSASWQAGQRRPSAPVEDRWQERQRRPRPVTAAPWREASQHQAQPVEVQWQQRARTSRPIVVSPWGEGTPFYLGLEVPAGFGKPLRSDFRAPWQEGRHTPPGRTNHERPEPPVEPPCYVPPHGLAVDLLFDRPLDRSPNLLFICKRPLPPGTIVVPIRRTYMILNDVSLRRVSGDILLPALSMSLSLDHASWTYGFSASLPAEALDYLQPEVDGSPALLAAEVNGATFMLLAEGVSRERAFGTRTISVRGRGKNALLDAPYSPIMQFGAQSDRTLQQLMADVLTVNGVGLGWDVDFGVTDWLVPGGAWTTQGSYIAALNDIASAAGGYLQPHPVDDTLRLLPLYPSAPWDWPSASPDIVLPAAVAQQESIEWVSKPDYNSVVVAGAGAGGVRVNVKRAGTDGMLQAPMVTHSLITHVDAGRQRGRAVLSDTGRQARVGLRLPVLAETGIIMPGRFVRYVDGSTTRFGITRGVDVQVGQQGAEVWQSITLETHE